jgi:hypothetical protein
MENCAHSNKSSEKENVSIQRRSTTPYGIYYQENYKNFAEKHPELGKIELKRVIASCFRGLNSEERKTYNNKSKQATSSKKTTFPPNIKKPKKTASDSEFRSKKLRLDKNPSTTITPNTPKRTHSRLKIIIISTPSHPLFHFPFLLNCFTTYHLSPSSCLALWDNAQPLPSSHSTHTDPADSNSHNE